MLLARRTLLLIFIFTLPVIAQVFPGNFTGYTQTGRSVRVTSSSYGVKITFLNENITRVDLITSSAPAADTSLIVVRDTTSDVPFTVSETSASLTISTSAMKIAVTKNPVRLSYYNASDKLLLSEPPSGGMGTGEDIIFSRFDMQQDDHFYGTGERALPLDLKGKSFYNFNNQVYGYHSEQPVMNINVPFVISPSGYGILFDNPNPGLWDFGNEDPSKWVYGTMPGSFTYYIIASDSIPGILERYTWLTGRQPLPPKWAFGFIQSKFGYQSAPEARNIVNTLRQKKIPADAIVLDLYWFSSMGDISWNLNNFPDPHPMMQEFLSKGIKTIVITEPYITESSVNFQEAASNGYLGKTSSGTPYLIPNWWSCGCNAGLIDMTNPAARSWWWSKHPAFMGNEMAGLWTDLGEPESHPTDMIHMGGSATRIHNIYNLLWAKAVFEGYASFRPGKRLFNLTRSGYAGIQRYGAITWSGDVGKSFSALAVQLPMLLNMGMSGLAYHNTDIGGFTAGVTTPELYTRWLQFGAFTPVMRAHGASQPTEPWAFGAEAEVINKKFIELRYRLQPYNYTLAYENYTTGMPFARPLFFADPDYNLLSSISSAYLWGNSFVVSPSVFSNETAKTFYLPKGTWVDFWNDKIYNGGSYAAVSAPLEQIALLVRSGSIIPMQPVMNYTDERPADTLYLAVYPDPLLASEYELYEDDGISLDYQSGSRSMTTFAQRMDNSVNPTWILNVSRSEGMYTGKPAARSYFPEVHLITAMPEAVKKNGIALPVRTALNDLHNGEGYYYDAVKKILYVHFRASSDSAYEITADNAHILTSVSVRNTSVPDRAVLEQNYPNPFNPVTTIRFAVPSDAEGRVISVSLKVFDILGREITTIVNEAKAPGTYEAEFNAAGLPSGIYIYRLQAGSSTLIRKMNLVK